MEEYVLGVFVGEVVGGLGEDLEAFDDFVLVADALLGELVGVLLWLAEEVDVLGLFLFGAGSQVF